MLLSSSLQKQIFEDKEQAPLPLFPLIAFSPVGNPLDSLSTMQRQFFFNSLFRLLQLQTAENESRMRRMMPLLLPPLSAMGVIMGKSASRSQRQEKRAKERLEQGKTEEAGQTEKITQAQREKEAQRLPGQSELVHAQHPKTVKMGAAKKGLHAQMAAKQSAGMLPEAGAHMAPLLDAPLRMKQEGQIERQKNTILLKIVFKQHSQQVASAQKELAAIINDYARGDAAKAQEIISEFSSRLESQDYKPDELGAVLLLVIEDAIWAGEEGGLGSAKSGGAASRVQALIPGKVKKSAAQSAEIRLASVREMLRYYFLRHPGEYRAALAMALGVPASELGDEGHMQQLVAAEIAEIGSFALAQKVLAAIKQQKDMDTKKCILELGYKYDAKNRKLIVGKRTCGKPSEARGIIAALLSKFKKPNNSKG